MISRQLCLLLFVGVFTSSDTEFSRHWFGWRKTARSWENKNEEGEGGGFAPPCRATHLTTPECLNSPCLGSNTEGVFVSSTMPALASHEPRKRPGMHVVDVQREWSWTANLHSSIAFVQVKNVTPRAKRQHNDTSTSIGPKNRKPDTRAHGPDACTTRLHAPPMWSGFESAMRQDSSRTKYHILDLERVKSANIAPWPRTADYCVYTCWILTLIPEMCVPLVSSEKRETVRGTAVLCRAHTLVGCIALALECCGRFHTNQTGKPIATEAEGTTLTEVLIGLGKENTESR